MVKKYTISDGKLMLDLWPAEEGGYTVTSPLDPGLITEAETLEEAFRMAYDAMKCLKAARAKLAGGSGTQPRRKKSTQPNVPSPPDPEHASTASNSPGPRTRNIEVD